MLMKDSPRSLPVTSKVLQSPEALPRIALQIPHVRARRASVSLTYDGAYRQWLWSASPAKQFGLHPSTASRRRSPESSEMRGPPAPAHRTALVLKDYVRPKVSGFRPQMP